MTSSSNNASLSSASPLCDLQFEQSSGHDHTHFNTMPRDLIGAVFEEYGRLPADKNSRAESWPECDPEFAEFCRQGFPLKLAGVCRLWRSVAQDFPRNWTTVKAVLSPPQGASSETVQVLNQAEIDTIATFSGKLPIRLCFATSSKHIANASSTGLCIDRLLDRVEAVLLDATCPSVLAAFAKCSFPKLHTIVVGDSKDTRVALDAWSEALRSRAWYSNDGVKKLVWYSHDASGLGSGFDWAALNEFRMACRSISLRRGDVYRVVVHSKSLTTLTLCVGLNRAYPTPHFDNPATPPARIVRHDSLTTLRVFFRTMDSFPSTTPLNHLCLLSLPNLKRLVVEYDGATQEPETRWLKSAAIVGSVEYFHITAGAIGQGDLPHILRAMPGLRDLRIAPIFYHADWRPDIPLGYGLQDWILRILAESTGPLTTFKAYGQSWITQGALASFLAVKPTLKELTVAAWGGGSLEQLDSLRLAFPDRTFHCGLVAPCKKNPGFVPETIVNPASGLDMEDLDPFDDWFLIYRYEDIGEGTEGRDLRTMICRECGDIHVAQELDRSLYGEPATGAVPREYGCS